MQSISILLEEKIIRKHRTYIIRKSVLKSLFYIFKPSSLPQTVDTLVSFCCIADKLMHKQSNCNEMYRTKMSLGF